MNRFPFFTAIILATLFLFTQGCASADKMLEAGEYDNVIRLAQRKLTGKQRKSPKLVAAVEAAYARVTARDLAEVDRLKSANRESNWGRINGIYRDMRKRQQVLAPLLPITDKNGYTAYFEVVNVDRMEEESRTRAAAYHYVQGQQLLNRARTGDKSSARAAHRELAESLKYFRGYKDATSLQQEAHEIGISHILVKVENRAHVIVPQRFEDRLLQVNMADLNTFWEEYHINPRAGLTFDYRINLDITQINVSPERVREREYVDTKEIEDGFEYVLDNNGNVTKDSLGNDITVARIVTVKALVIEVLQEKEAHVEGTVKVFSLPTNRLLRSQPLGASVLFENYASTFRGDERALSRETRRRIGNRPGPFPTNESMILQAADELKPVLLDKILDYRSLVQA